jgi:CRISPR type III-A-associated RAMP protein Csm4
MSYKAFKISFTSPLHMSDIRANDYGKSERILRSDTLVAAIMQTWAMLGKEEWIKQDSGFTTSCLFPFTTATDESKENVFFLPKPFCGLNIPKNLDDSGFAKKAKKVQYFDTEYFQLALKQTEVKKSNEAHYQGAYQSSRGIDTDFLSSDTRIRITKPRNDSDDAKPFYMEQLRFKSGSGMWGVAWFENETIEKRVEAAFHYLQDAGLGTDRNVGNGQFVFKWLTEMPIPIEKPTTYGLNLSLFCPENETDLAIMLDEKARYELIKRGGWLSEPHTGLRKRSVYMFKEGSVFRLAKPENVQGSTVDLQPEILGKKHPVWRSGKAIFIPIEL